MNNKEDEVKKNLVMRIEEKSSLNLCEPNRVKVRKQKCIMTIFALLALVAIVVGVAAIILGSIMSGDIAVDEYLLTLQIKDVETGEDYSYTGIVQSGTGVDDAISEILSDCSLTIDESRICGWYLDSECRHSSKVADVNSAIILYSKFATLDKLDFAEVTDNNGIVVSYEVKAKASNDENSTVSGEIVTPLTYNGLPVTRVADYGFVGDVVGIDETETTYQVLNVDKVTLAEGIEEIGEYAFLGAQLQQIVFPTTLKTICFGAFSGASKLQSVDLSHANVETIGYHAFADCSSLASVLLPNSISIVEGGAFYGCNLLSTIVEDGISYFGNDENPYLILYKVTDTSMEEVDINANTKIIYQSAFEDCSSLTSVDLSQCATLTQIGNQAFLNCNSLTSIYFPSSLSKIGYGAFGNTSVNSVYITDLEAWAQVEMDGTAGEVYVTSPFRWYGAATLYVNEEVVTHVDLSDTNITRIGAWAFAGLKQLTSVSLPKTLTSIGAYAFAACNNIENVYITNYNAYIAIDFENETSNPMYNAKNLYINNVLSNYKNVTELVLSDETLTAFDEYHYANVDSLELVDLSGCTNLTAIGSGVFRDCENLTTVILPDSVEIIGEYAFEGCSSLSSITIPSNVTYIGAGAFSLCESLCAVYIEDLNSWAEIDFVSIESNPLKYAGSLYVDDVLATEITFSTNILGISDYAFYCCTSINSIDLSNCGNLQSIGKKAFSDCTSLTSIDMSGCTKLQDIGVGAFYNCIKLTSTDLSNCVSIQTIGNSAYCNCSELTSIDFSDCAKLEHIEDCAFYNCTSLSSVDLSNCVDLQSIGRYAFKIVSEITEDKTTFLTINLQGCASLNSIGYGAFSGSSILNIDLSDTSLTILSDYLFGNSLIESIVFPETITTIGYRCFCECTSLASLDLKGYTNLESIEDYAFYNCYKLASIDLSGCVNLQSIGIAAFGYVGCGSSSVSSMDEETETEEVKGGEMLAELCINSESIEGEAISTTINLQGCASLNSIGYSAFSGSSISSIDLSDTCLTTLQDNSFSHSSIESIVLPETLTTIDSSCFAYCASLISLDLYNCINLTSIGMGAFYRCTNLEYVVFPSSLTTINCCLFYSNESLTSIYFPDGIKEIKTILFNGSDFGKVVIYTRYTQEEIEEISSTLGAWNKAGSTCFEVKYGFSYEQYVAEISGGTD